MKVLVLGAAGMAGHVIALYFKEKGHEVTGFVTRPISFCNYIIGDARDIKSLKKILLEGEYDALYWSIKSVCGKQSFFCNFLK